MDSEVHCVALQLEYCVFQSTSHNLFFQIFRKLINQFRYSSVPNTTGNLNKYLFAIIILTNEKKGFF